MTKKGKTYLLAMAALICLTPSCSDRRSDHDNHRPTSSADSGMEALVAGFWNDIDFSKDTKTTDTAFIGQKFADFTVLLNTIPEDAAGRAIDSLLMKASEREEAFGLLEWTITHYLDDPNSPMRDGDLYAAFLRRIAESENVPEASRVRSQSRLVDALKNREGTPATDFRLITRDGRETTLGREVERNGLTIVIFYDPECTRCSALESRLQDDSELERLAGEGKTGVLAVVPFDTDARLFRRHAATLPADWTVGFSPGGEIEEKELFIIRATPTIYTIRQDMTVTGKDISEEMLFRQIRGLDMTPG